MDPNINLEIIGQYAQMLKATFSASNDVQRKEAEQNLQAASAQDPLFLNNLLNLLLVDTIEATIKQSASLYALSYVKVLQASRSTSNQADDPHYPAEKRHTHLLLLFQTLVNPNVVIRYKIQLSSALTNLLYSDKTNHYKAEIYQNLLAHLEDKNLNVISGTLLVSQSLINSTDNISQLRKSFENLIQPLESIGTLLYDPIKQFLEKFVDLNPSQQIREEFNSYINALSVWVQTIKQFIFKFMDHNSSSSNSGTSQQNQSEYKHAMKDVVQRNYLVQLIMQILSLIPIKHSLQVQNCMFSTSNIKEIDDGLNEIKVTTLTVYNKINSYSFNERPSLDIKKSCFFQGLEALLPAVINSLVLFATQKIEILQHTIESDALKGLLVQALVLLTKSASQQDFNQLFAQRQQELVVHVIFVLMRTSEYEYEQFSEKPEEFVNLAVDTCDKQLSQVPKTQAAQLLEILCDHVDGAMSLVGGLTIEIMLYSMQSDSVEHIPKNFPKLLAFKDSHFINKALTPAEIRTETCFVALSVMSYMVPKRVDLVQLLEKLIRDNQDNLMGPMLPKLLKSRFCLFLSYYSDTLFLHKEDSDLYQRLIMFMVQSATDKNEHESVIFQAIDSLSNIFDDEQLSQRLTDCSPAVFEFLSTNILDNKHSQFLDLIHTLTTSFSKQLMNNLPVLKLCLANLVEKIKIEQGLIDSKQRTTQINLNKCWNIIRFMCDSADYFVGQADDLELSIQALLDCIQFPDKIEFEDDIILAISALIKKRRGVNDRAIHYLQYFKQVFVKQEQMMGQIFQCLNNYVHYGQYVFGQSPQFLIPIIEIAIESMCSKSQRVNEADNSEGATLLQQIVMQYGANISDEVYQQILQRTIQRTQNTIENNFLKARVLGIFICSMMTNFDKVVPYMQQTGILESIVITILDNIKIYHTWYDIKVFIIGMSNVFMRPNVPAELSKYIVKILDYIITLLNTQYQKESKNVKKRNDSDSEFDDDSDDDLDDDDYLDKEGYDDTVQDKLMLNHMEIAIKEQDEFEFFKFLIQHLKNQNQQELHNLIQQLPSEKRTYLQNIVYVKRIKLGDEKGTSSVRKIVKVKKSTNQ